MGDGAVLSQEAEILSYFGQRLILFPTTHVPATATILATALPATTFFSFSMA